jgi:hypothetical protein
MPDRETVISVMKENDLLLKQELKTILTEEQYQGFLDSHPEKAMPFPKPPVVQENR